MILENKEGILFSLFIRFKGLSALISPDKEVGMLLKMLENREGIFLIGASKKVVTLDPMDLNVPKSEEA